MERSERIKHILEIFDSLPADVQMALMGGMGIEAMARRKEQQ